MRITHRTDTLGMPMVSKDLLATVEVFETIRIVKCSHLVWLVGLKLNNRIMLNKTKLQLRVSQESRSVGVGKRENMRLW